MLHAIVLASASPSDNGPESSGRRTQFLKRMVDFADATGKTIQLLYFPPYHSKYNPVERCWGILERHWNGAKLVDADTMLEWAKSMTWKGIQPAVTLCRKTYAKGEVAGVVESVKAAADVYMPIDGTVTEVNEALRADPALANSDPQGAGWFFKTSVANRAQFDELMDDVAYTKFSDAA